MIRALLHLTVPLGYMLQNWEIFSYVHVNERKLYFYCNTVYAQYSLRSGEQWPIMALLLYQNGPFAIWLILEDMCVGVCVIFLPESKSCSLFLVLLKVRHANVSKWYTLLSITIICFLKLKWILENWRKKIPENSQDDWVLYNELEEKFAFLFLCLLDINDLYRYLVT